MLPGRTELSRGSATARSVGGSAAWTAGAQGIDCATGLRAEGWRSRPAYLPLAPPDWHPQAAAPASLVQSTVRIALGFVTGERATVLARGVLSSMVVNQLKVAAALAMLAIGGGLDVAGDGRDTAGPEQRRFATS